MSMRIGQKIQKLSREIIMEILQTDYNEINDLIERVKRIGESL